MKLRYGIGILTALLALSACTAQVTAPLEPVSVQVFFYSPEDLQNATYEHPVSVSRTVAPHEFAADAVLRMLFAGPTEQERQMGVETSDDLANLGPLYLGVRVDGDVATVNFQPDALAILNSAAARQMMVKAPLEATLLGLPEIESVRYAIDGEIFEEWDA